MEGPWCRFRREARARERHRHRMMDSLKVLDPEWPIREADIYQVRHRRVAEQQPWALLDNCEAQNLEKPRNGTREEGDPLALVSKSPHASTLREIARDPVSFAQG